MSGYIIQGSSKLPTSPWVLNTLKRLSSHRCCSYGADHNYSFTAYIDLLCGQSLCDNCVPPPPQKKKKKKKKKEIQCIYENNFSVSQKIKTGT